MQTGNPLLIQVIRAEIEKHGPQSFAWFMQQALYHPGHGYYSSGRCSIGRKGDYFTNVSVGPLFGQLLAVQFVEIWERLGKTESFVIVEQGAHDGVFARDVLEFAQERAPDFFEALNYQIVEPFPIQQKRQRQTLKLFGDKVGWRDSLQPFTGVHFSNELLDAMPGRLISSGTEKLVGLDGDEFVFVERPFLQGTAAGRDAELPRNASGVGAARRAYETSNQTLEWIDEIAANLQRGYAIAIDYGCCDKEFSRNVQVRARHRNLGSPFEEIGNADITIPVDWTGIVRRARANGLRVAGFTDQHHFLTGLISDMGRGGSPEPPWGDWRPVTDAKQRPGFPSALPFSSKAKRELQTLLHPEMLGRTFQVLALSKNVDPEDTPLAGFKYAPGRARS